VDDDGYGGQAAPWARVIECFVFPGRDGVATYRRRAGGDW
jgi:hypothetical protein